MRDWGKATFLQILKLCQQRSATELKQQMIDCRDTPMFENMETIICKKHACPTAIAELIENQCGKLACLRHGEEHTCSLIIIYNQFWIIQIYCIMIASMILIPRN